VNAVRRKRRRRMRRYWVKREGVAIPERRFLAKP